MINFECGGFILGIVLFYLMCDGYGEGYIMCVLMELVWGKKKLLVMLVWERERFVGKIKENDKYFFIFGGDMVVLFYLFIDDWVCV